VASTLNVVLADDELPGLVWAFKSSPGRAPVQLKAEEIGSLLSEGGWVWRHFTLIDQRAPTRIVDTCRLPVSIQPLLAAHDDGLALGYEAGVVKCGVLA
jgi:hypothetical protein